MNRQPAPPDGRYIRPVDLDSDVRATLPARMQWGLEAFLWDWVYWKPLSAMSPERASNFGASLLKRLGPLTSQQRTIMRNLRMAFPAWDEKKINACASGAWENLGRIVGEMPHLAKLRPFQPGGAVEVVGVEKLNAVRESGRPAVLIGGHMANWEVMSATVANALPTSQITYRAANNPYIDRRIAQVRLDYGVRALAPKGAGTRELMRALAKGEPVALMNDQKFNQGIPVPFFGHDAMTAPGPTRLAMKYDALLLPLSTLRTGPARYRVTVYDPIEFASGPDIDAAVAMTVLKINQFIEARILEAPDQWFWMHNRWPKEAWVKAGVM